ncbi:hypothetical protein EFT62_04260 [Lactiplantibacillus plantarum]|nr:hypothetical protein [Lactiplantibacillus plantarum]
MPVKLLFVSRCASYADLRGWVTIAGTNEQPLNLTQLVADYIFYWKFKHNVRVALTTLSRRLIITMVIWE